VEVFVELARAATVELYRDTIAKALIEQLGAIKLSALTAGDVEAALGVLASKVSTRTVQIAHSVLVRAIRHAERHDLVGRNVAALVKPPRGQAGRASKALTLEQAVALLEAAEGTRLEAYIVVSLLSGMRTEEVRALRWDHVVAWVDGQWRPVTDVGFDHEQLAVFVWRSDRTGGDTKTPRSRRTLALPARCVQTLREQRVRQAEERLAAGPLWRDRGLVFASTVGTVNTLYHDNNYYYYLLVACAAVCPSPPTWQSMPASRWTVGGQLAQSAPIQMAKVPRGRAARHSAAAHGRKPGADQASQKSGATPAVRMADCGDRNSGIGALRGPERHRQHDDDPK
jgi:integrase